MLRILSSFAVCSALALAQETPDTTEAAPPALPQANSDEARALVDKAIDKLIAYGRGRFASSEGQDQAMLRQAGLPFGPEDTEVDGGWHRDVVWGDADGREFVRANGRMLAKVDGDWRLRRDKLSGGVKVPFTADPAYLLTVLKRLPKAARAVEHVEAGKLKGKQCAILTCKLTGDAALEFADSGAIPDVGGGFGGMIVMGGMGALGGEPPRPDFETWLAFFVDRDSGDLLRFAVKSFQTDEMMGNIAVQVAGAGGVVEEVEEEEEEEAENAPIKWKRGFPNIKPKKDQSVLDYRLDFKDLGLAEPPTLADDLKALLRLR
jgi:hypothetical protein